MDSNIHLSYLNHVQDAGIHTTANLGAKPGESVGLAYDSLEKRDLWCLRTSFVTPKNIHLFFDILPPHVILKVIDGSDTHVERAVGLYRCKRSDPKITLRMT